MQGWEAPVPIFTNLFKGFTSYTGIPFVNKPGPDKSQRVKKKNQPQENISQFFNFKYSASGNANGQG